MKGTFLELRAGAQTLAVPIPLGSNGPGQPRLEKQLLEPYNRIELPQCAESMCTHPGFIAPSVPCNSTKH